MMNNAFKEHSSQLMSDTFLLGSTLIYFTLEQLRKKVLLLLFYRLKVYRKWWSLNLNLHCGSRTYY